MSVLLDHFGAPKVKPSLGRGRSRARLEQGLLGPQTARLLCWICRGGRRNLTDEGWSGGSVI